MGADARVEKGARGKKQIIGDPAVWIIPRTHNGGVQIYPGSYFEEPLSRSRSRKLDRALRVLAFGEREKGIEKCPVFATFRANELSNASSPGEQCTPCATAASEKRNPVFSNMCARLTNYCTFAMRDIVQRGRALCLPFAKRVNIHVYIRAWIYSYKDNNLGYTLACYFKVL